MSHLSAKYSSSFTAAGTVLIALLSSVNASAQTEGRIGVGGSITAVHPRAEELGRAVRVGPLIRLNPKRGWGIAGGLNWFESDLKDASTGTRAARVTVRPLMGGVGFTAGPDKTLITVSIVAGPSFNSIEWTDAAQTSQNDTFEISFVVRPGLTLTQSLARRVGVVAFVGYQLHRSGFTVRNGIAPPGRVDTDALVLSIGGVYSLF